MGDITMHQQPHQKTTATETNRPDDSPFKQQQLPAWQPIQIPLTSFPVFLLLTVILVPLGVGFLITSQGVREFQYDYTYCPSVNDSSVTCASLRDNRSDPEMTSPCSCSIQIQLEESFIGDVYFYYGLEGFYQNHGKYVKSRDDNQLNGEQKTAKQLINDCKPYSYYVDNTTGEQTPIAPAGLVANSLFNDSFTLINTSSTSAEVPLLFTGIAWPTDHSTKFVSPSPNDNLTEAFASYDKPFWWPERVENLGAGGDSSQQGYKNEAFEVWMRMQAFPRFRKMYARLDRSRLGYASGLPAGTYTIVIDYNYPMSAVHGRKRFIISTLSWLGKKNSFLGVAYVVGTVVPPCILCVIIERFD